MKSQYFQIKYQNYGKNMNLLGVLAPLTNLTNFNSCCSSGCDDKLHSFYSCAYGCSPIMYSLHITIHSNNTITNQTKCAISIFVGNRKEMNAQQGKIFLAKLPSTTLQARALSGGGGPARPPCISLHLAAMQPLKKIANILINCDSYNVFLKGVLIRRKKKLINGLCLAEGKLNILKTKYSEKITH